MRDPVFVESKRDFSGEPRNDSQFLYSRYSPLTRQSYPRYDTEVLPSSGVVCKAESRQLKRMIFTRLGGPNNIRCLFQKLINQDQFKSRSGAIRHVTGFMVTNLLCVAVPLVFIPMPLLSLTDTGSSIEFKLDISALILPGITSPIRIIPGDSNTTIEQKRKTDEINTKLHHAVVASGVMAKTTAGDTLIQSITAFLQSKQSPLANHVDELVGVSVDYNLDPRMLVGIAGAESSFGLRMPEGSHNPFGLGPSRRFSSFNEAFLAEARFLNKNFTSRGVTSPHQIGPTYTGTGSKSWGVSVAGIMARI